MTFVFKNVKYKELFEFFSIFIKIDNKAYLVFKNFVY